MILNFEMTIFEIWFLIIGGDGSQYSITYRPPTHTGGGQQWTGELRPLPPVSMGKNLGGPAFS